MISRKKLAKEYIKIVNNYYPVSSRLLNKCLVIILTFNADRTTTNFYYLGIYYPAIIGDPQGGQQPNRLLEQQDIFRSIAKNMGLGEVVFLNANRLVKDPLSKIKEQNFRFWLELCWIANEVN